MNFSEFRCLNHKQFFFPEVLESFSVSLFTSNCNFETQGHPDPFAVSRSPSLGSQAPAVTYGFISFALILRVKVFSDKNST